MEFMGLYAFPQMRSLFVAFNPKAYKTFRCQTCHGADMEAVDFKMPNGLYALPVEGAEKAALEYDEPTARFMIDRVLPAMQTLLAKDDPELQKSFGCHGCHAKE